MLDSALLRLTSIGLCLSFGSSASLVCGDSSVASLVEMAICLIPRRLLLGSFVSHLDIIHRKFCLQLWEEKG